MLSKDGMGDSKACVTLHLPFEIRKNNGGREEKRKREEKESEKENRE